MTTKARKRKPKTVSPETSSSGLQPPASGPDSLSLGQVIRVPLDRLVRHPDNRRPPQESIDKVAASIERDGQLEPVLIRTLDATQQQILSGETRWLACKQLRRRDIAARLVYDCDDATALRIVAAGNAARTDLNPVDRARLLQRLTADDGGRMTQEQAGAVLGLSRPAVANALRLLDAPAPVLQYVETGRLPETFLREFLPALAVAPKLVEKAIAKTLPKSGPIDDSREGFVDSVVNAVRQETRSLDAATYDSGGRCDQVWSDAHFKPTPEQLEQLAVIEVPTWHGKMEKRATNVALWKQLQAEALKKKRGAKKPKPKGASPGSRTAGSAPSAGASRGSAKQLAAAEAERRKLAAAQLKKRLAAFRYDWDQYLIARALTETKTNPADRLAVDAMVLRVLLWCSTQIGQEPGQGWTSAVARFSHRESALTGALSSGPTSGARKRSGSRRGRMEWSPLAAIAEVDTLERTAVQFVANLCWYDDQPASLLPRDLVHAIADGLQIDRRRAWKADRAGPLTDAFFELFTREQLLDLAKEWSITGLAPSAKVADLRTALAGNPKTRTLPKCLTGIKTR